MTDSLSPLAGPGVALALLQRGATSTDVLLVASERGAAGLPCSAARPERTQWQLAEDLVGELAPLAVTRLYASAITVQHDRDSFGVFVGFVDERDPSKPGAADWADLREAAEQTSAPWPGALREVRSRFVAQPPDEAFRVR